MQNMRFFCFSVYVVQELWASDHDLSDLSSAYPCHHITYQCLDKWMLKYMYMSMQYLIKIYGAVQELWAFSLMCFQSLSDPRFSFF